MNIAIFASAFYPRVGGVEELCRQLALQLIQKGHRVIILTNRWPRNLPEFEDYQGIPVYRLPFRLPDGSIKAKLSYLLTNRSIRKDTLRIIREFKADILHVQCVSSNGFYAGVASSILGIPLVVTAQGERTMDATQLYQKSRYMNRLLHNLLNQADYITACSGQTLDDLREYHGGFGNTASSVVYNGIDPDEFSNKQPFSHPKPYILGIGRLVKQKGFDLLIKAFHQSGIIDWDLLVAGEGPERQSLESLAIELGVGARVVFMGRAERPKAVSLFKGSSAFVLPSRHEPFGIVNIEAMAAGSPVIATRVGGVPEIITHGVNGYLVNPEDPEALAGAILELYKSEDLRNSLANEGRRRAEAFSWDVVTEQYLDIYKKVAR